MRLIDADRLKEVFRRNTGYDYPDIIDNQPTAYDVDKVVEQLEMLETNSKEQLIKCSIDGSKSGMNKYHEKRMAFHDAIEIVRKGGVECDEYI